MASTVVIQDIYNLTLASVRLSQSGCYPQKKLSANNYIERIRTQLQVIK